MITMIMKESALTVKAKAHIRPEEAEDDPEADPKVAPDRDLHENIAKRDTIGIGLEVHIRGGLPHRTKGESRGLVSNTCLHLTNSSFRRHF